MKSVDNMTEEEIAKDFAYVENGCKALGITVRESDGSIKSMYHIMQELREVWDKSIDDSEVYHE